MNDEDKQLVRDFYLAQVEEWPLLEKIVLGETTFAGRLNTILHSISESKGNDLDEKIERFKEYIQDLADLGRKASDEMIATCCETVTDCADVAQKKKTYNTLTKGSMALGSFTSFLGIVLLGLPPPFTLWVGGLVSVLGLGGTIGGSLAFDNKASKISSPKYNARNKVLAPIYEAVKVIDNEIANLFVIEHFYTQRKRFTRTYRGMPEEERQRVQEQLIGHLDSEMHGNSLVKYLNGLLEDS